MNWYYVENGGRKGPVDGDEMNRLVSAGRVTPGTMVWREGLADWQPYSAAKESAISTASGSAASSEQARCAECGQFFPTSEMVQYQDSFICPSCKPVFFQKIKEGVALTGEMIYAGFWIRFGAEFIDGIILQVVNWLVRFAVLAGLRAAGAESVFPVLNIVISLAIGAAYSIYFIGTYGATPGKMALRLKVVTADGGKVGYGLACGRYFAKILSSLILGIGFIMAAFDEQKRALHDRICDTRVIRTNS